MKNKIIIYIPKTLIFTLLFFLISSDMVLAEPDYRFAAHSQGNIQLILSNGGGTMQFNDGYYDPITGDSVYALTYPSGSNIYYSSLSVHIGGIIGRDTLVSNSWELYPPEFPFSPFIKRSIDISKSFYSTEANSELDLLCEYYDTVLSVPKPPVSGWDIRNHIPLGLKINQKSMAWSGDQVDDFIIIDYQLSNIGKDDLSAVWVGLRVGSIAGFNITEVNNLNGFLNLQDSGNCPSQLPLQIAYLMDNDGNPVGNSFDRNSPLAAVGIALLGSSPGARITNYNWWQGINDLRESWGPRQSGKPGDPFRSIGPFLGHPYKDNNMYYMMRHREIDYDQLFSAVNHLFDGWLSPPGNAEEIARGVFGGYLLSFGPYNIPRGSSINFTIAIVGGDNVHTDPTAYDHLMDPLNPQPYYDQLDFSELIENSRWARRVYDNPGVDSDSDGYAGEFSLCDGDTIWYKGDGVPDFRGDTPPVAPVFKVITNPGKFIIRFNGYLSETTLDQFVGVIDFEGYRIYAGLDNRRSSLSVMTSYDHLNFRRFRFKVNPSGTGRWVDEDFPFSLDTLQLIYNDTTFDPLRYTRIRPLVTDSQSYYFETVDFNQSDLTSNRGIHKVYPNAIDPGTDPSLWTEDEITLEHGDPLPKYYEYEYIIKDVLPTVPYFISVTAFDFGTRGQKLPPQENNPLNNLIEAYAQFSTDTVAAENLDAYVYPNPYRTDADYEGRGYEDRGSNMIPDRARRIHFSNLPNRCNIYVYSIDGDLIWSTFHDFPKDSPEGMHDIFPLVSRNYQAVESGLYYWVVESETRTQIGKLVIIR